jgi:hypothetical protein
MTGNTIRSFRGGFAVLCNNGGYYYFPAGLIEELHRAYGEGSHIVPQDDKGPVPGVIQIIDPCDRDLRPYKPHKWLIEWPHFSPKLVGPTITALLAYEGIGVAIRIKPFEKGIYHIYRELKTVADTSDKYELRKSKHGWERLYTQPEVVLDGDVSILLMQLNSWKKSRRLLWKIEGKTISPGKVRIRRLDFEESK